MRLLGLILAGAGAMFIWSVMTGQSPLAVLQDLARPQLLVSDLTYLFTHTHAAGSSSSSSASTVSAAPQTASASNPVKVA